MWFIKSELRKQIDKYNKDKDILLEFARFVKKPCLEDIYLEDIKSFYKAIVAPKNSQWERNSYMLAVRKFFKYYRGENILKWQQILDNPLISGELNAIVPVMKAKEKRKPGRPIDWENVKKTLIMKDKLGMSFRDIGKTIIKGRVVDHSQVIKWYQRGKKHKGELSTV